QNSRDLARRRRSAGCTCWAAAGRLLRTDAVLRFFPHPKQLGKCILNLRRLSKIYYRQAGELLRHLTPIQWCNLDWQQTKDAFSKVTLQGLVALEPGLLVLQGVGRKHGKDVFDLL